MLRRLMLLLIFLDHTLYSKGLKMAAHHILDKTRELILSSGFWHDSILLVLGAAGGAMLSTWYAIKAQKPKLIISGSGSGGNQQTHCWNITISNLPSFLGNYLYGELALEIRGSLHLKDSKSHYPVYWDPEHVQNITIEPGQQHSLVLFHWTQSQGISSLTVVMSLLLNSKIRGSNSYSQLLIG